MYNICLCLVAQKLSWIYMKNETNETDLEWNSKHNANALQNMTHSFVISRILLHDFSAYMHSASSFFIVLFVWRHISCGSSVLRFDTRPQTSSKKRHFRCEWSNEANNSFPYHWTMIVNMKSRSAITLRRRDYCRLKNFRLLFGAFGSGFYSVPLMMFNVCLLIACMRNVHFQNGFRVNFPH